MHAFNIVHGDLTTSNMILKNGKTYFIDFGLGTFSKRIEDKATDLNVFRKAMISTHFKIFKTCWKSFVLGYEGEYREAEKVVNQLNQIEGRSRYTKEKTFNSNKRLV